MLEAAPCRSGPGLRLRAWKERRADCKGHAALGKACRTATMCAWFLGCIDVEAGRHAAKQRRRLSDVVAKRWNQ